MSDDIVDRLRAELAAAAKANVAAADEIVRLRRWKDEATTVLDAWNDCWKAAGRPGPLGASTAQSTAIEIGRLRTRVVELEAETERANGLSAEMYRTERALADQLAEALRALYEHGDATRYTIYADSIVRFNGAKSALAAYDRARTPPS